MLRQIVDHLDTPSGKVVSCRQSYRPLAGFRIAVACIEVSGLDGLLLEHSGLFEPALSPKSHADISSPVEEGEVERQFLPSGAQQVWFGRTHFEEYLGVVGDGVEGDSLDRRLGNNRAMQKQNAKSKESPGHGAYHSGFRRSGLPRRWRPCWLSPERKGMPIFPIDGIWFDF